MNSILNVNFSILNTHGNLPAQLNHKIKFPLTDFLGSQRNPSFWHFSFWCSIALTNSNSCVLNLKQFYASVFSLQELKFDQMIAKEFLINIVVMTAMVNLQLIHTMYGVQMEKSAKLTKVKQISKIQQKRICGSYYYITILNLSWESMNYVLIQ